MKAVEFDATVTPNGLIEIPAEVATQVPPGEPLHVVLQWNGVHEESLWRDQALERFEAAYAPEDSIYEQLMDEPSTR